MAGPASGRLIGPRSLPGAYERTGQHRTWPPGAGERLRGSCGHGSGRTLHRFSYEMVSLLVHKSSQSPGRRSGLRIKEDSQYVWQTYRVERKSTFCCQSSHTSPPKSISLAVNIALLAGVKKQGERGRMPHQRHLYGHCYTSCTLIWETSDCVTRSPNRELRLVNHAPCQRPSCGPRWWPTKVPTPRVDQLVFRRPPPRARACFIR